MINKLLERNPRRLFMIGDLSKFIMPRLPHSLSDAFDEPLEVPEVEALLYAKHLWEEEQKTT